MQFIQSLLLCLSNKWIPLLVFKKDSFRRLFAFGWKILVSGLIDTLYKNIYYVIIGKYFSAIELGYYTNAQKIRDTASHSITTSVQKVSYPVFSSIQDEEKRLRFGYKKIIKNSVFITFPIMIGLAAVADPLIYLLFGANWVASIPYFQVLCFAGMLFPLHAINLNILQVKGRSDLFLRLEIIKKLIGVVSIVIILFLKLGIMGLLWAAVLNSFLSYYLNSYYSAELLSYSTKDQIKDIFSILVVSLLMGIAVYFAGLAVSTENLFVELFLKTFVGVLTYIGLSKIMKIEELITIYGLICSGLKKIKNNNTHI